MTIQLRARGESHVGMVRKQNEDAFLIDEALGLYVVADGMGGHVAGAVASKKAVEVVRGYLAERSADLSRLRADASEGARLEGTSLVAHAIQEACRVVHEVGRRETDKRGMGTTLSCVLHLGDGVAIGHVGDSRIYLLRRGEINRLTDDHTLAAAQVKAGIIAKSDVAASPFRSILTRSLGTHASVQVDTLYVELSDCDLFLLCSDGLHGLVEDRELPAHLSAENLTAAPDGLIALANARGGNDNVTVVALACARERTAARDAVDARMAVVAALPLFHHLDYRERVAVLSIAKARDVEAGTRIVEEGTRASDLFLILEGTAAVESAGRRLAELKPGAHFGEMALVEDSPRSASVVALEPMRVMVIGRPEMMGLMRVDPVLAVKILWTLVQSLSSRLRVTSAEHLEYQAEYPAEQPRDTLPSPFEPSGQA